MSFRVHISSQVKLPPHRTRDGVTQFGCVRRVAVDTAAAEIAEIIRQVEECGGFNSGACVEILVQREPIVPEVGNGPR